MADPQSPEAEPAEPGQAAAAKPVVRPAAKAVERRSVPLAVLIEERRRRQVVETRLAELRVKFLNAWGGK